jgi:hypothetical protein
MLRNINHLNIYLSKTKLKGEEDAKKTPQPSN